MTPEVSYCGLKRETWIEKFGLRDYAEDKGTFRKLFYSEIIYTFYLFCVSFVTHLLMVDAGVEVKNSGMKLGLSSSLSLFVRWVAHLRIQL